MSALSKVQELTAADALIEYGVTHIRGPECERAIATLHVLGFDTTADALGRYRDSIRELFGDDEGSDVVRRISDYSERA